MGSLVESNERDPGDIAIEWDSVSLFVGEVSLPFLDGCDVDYVQ